MSKAMLIFAFLTSFSAKSIERVTLDSSGLEGNGGSSSPSLSQDGNLVVFSSRSSNLVVGDNNGVQDIFLYNRSTGSVERVSVSTSGVEANGDSFNPKISADGMYVVFESVATNLDLSVSLESGQNQALERQIFVRSLVAGSIETYQVTRTSGDKYVDGGSGCASISDDGKVIGFCSAAADLVAGDVNGKVDYFVYDFVSNLSAGVLSRVSVSETDSEGNGHVKDGAVSGNGAYAVFSSASSNLVSSDSNESVDVFRREIGVANSTVLVSKGVSGTLANGSSASAHVDTTGRFVSFVSVASNLTTDNNLHWDIFVKDVDTGAVTLLTRSMDFGQIDRRMQLTGMSGDSGRYVSFYTRSSVLDNLDGNSFQDAYVADRISGEVKLVSKSSTNTVGDNKSRSVTLSKDGRTVAFESSATNLVAGDQNSSSDIFVAENPIPATVVRVIVNSPNVVEGDTATFTFLRSDYESNSDPLTVEFSISGSATEGLDYSSPPAVVTFPANQDYVTLDLATVNDAFVEGSETVTLSVLGLSGYSRGYPDHEVSVALTDNDSYVVSIAATDDLAYEGSLEKGQIQLTRSGGGLFPLEVNLQVSGNATNGSDYSFVSSLVTMEIGQTQAIIDVNPIADTIGEGLEYAEFTLLGGVGYTIDPVPSHQSARVQIYDDELATVTISATDAVATEEGVSTGSFRISRTPNTSGDLIVNVLAAGTALSGVDYVAISEQVTIPDLSDFVDVVVSPLPDSVAESTETIHLRIVQGASYFVGESEVATVMLKDNLPIEAVKVTASDPVAEEVGQTPGQFKVERTGTVGDLEVRFLMAGTAQPSIDYTLSPSVNSPSVVTIPDGSTSVDLTLTPLDDAVVESSEKAIFHLIETADYRVSKAFSQAAIEIKDSELPEVSVLGKSYVAREDGTTMAEFFVARRGDLSQGLVVSFQKTGTATDGLDYVLPDQITIPAGEYRISVKVEALADSDREGVEILKLDVKSSGLYYLGEMTQLQLLITDAISPFALNPNAPLNSASASFDGNYIAFSSEADNLVVGDGNGFEDVFIYDFQAATITRIKPSVVEPNGPSYEPQISGNGQYVVFTSAATNFSPGDINHHSDIFRYALASGEIEKVSRGVSGAMASGPSHQPSVSDSGLRVAFSSEASNLVANDTNGKKDVFLYDFETGLTSLISSHNGLLISGFSGRPKISGDGSRVVFESQYNLSSGTNDFRHIYLYEYNVGTLQWVSGGYVMGSEGNSHSADLSHDGSQIVFASQSVFSGLASSGRQIYKMNIENGELKLVSSSVSGDAANKGTSRPRISADGQRVMFISAATNLSIGSVCANRAFIKDLGSGAVRTVLSSSAASCASHVDTSAEFIRDSGELLLLSKRNGSQFALPIFIGSPL